MVTTSRSRVREEAREQESVRDRPKKLNRLAREFQPDAVEIERRSTPGGARWTLYVVIALIIAAIAWASLTKVDRIVVAQGKLVPVEAPVTVQAAEPSPIKEVFVKFGSIVQPGQTLAILDSTFSETEVKQATEELQATNAKIARLAAEQKREDYEAADPDDLEQVRQYALFVARRSAYNSNLAEIEQEIERTQASIQRSTRMIELNEERKVNLQQEVDRYQKLNDMSAIDKAQLMSAKDSLLECEMRIEDSQLQIVEMKQQIEGFEKRKLTFISEWDKEVLETLVEAESKRRELEAKIKNARRKIELATLKVPDNLPYDTYMVTQAAEKNVESVLQQAESVFKLIPVLNDSAGLEVEVAIPGKDIGHEFDGDVIVKFSAFPYQKYGYATGKVYRISEESLGSSVQNQQQNSQGEGKKSDASEQASYRARIQLDEGWIDEMQFKEPPKFYPGMTVTAEINVGDRRVIEYFLYPLFRNLDKSIREP